ncbi:hypothetical protein ATCC90586_009437 [Pythium insidiosum]|nr:hypothetical protein ATCC90586_009437 [Pythium insidiosum]
MADAQRVADVVAVRRASSLANVRVDVTVAHSTSRLRTRFCVEMWRVVTPTTTRFRWMVGVRLRDMAAVRAALRRLVLAPDKHWRRRDSHARAPAPLPLPTRAAHTAETCETCAALRQEVATWPRLPRWSAGIGRRKRDDTCDLLQAFVQRMLEIVARFASSLPTCDVFRELEHIVAATLRVPSENDDSVLGALASLRPVPALAVAAMADQDCSVCLESLLGSDRSAATRVVELQCSHRFHGHCICTWFQSKLSCPTCRRAPCEAQSSSQ